MHGKSMDILLLTVQRQFKCLRPETNFEIECAYHEGSHLDIK